MAFWDRVFFEEIDGKKRKVTLAATEAPHGHFRGDSALKGLGREVRRSRHEEPGSHVPGIHVTGSKLKDLSLKVHFRDSLTGASGRALAMVQTIDGIVKDARLLRIVWGSTLYRGLLLDFDVEAEAEGEFTANLVFERYDTQPQRKSLKRPVTLSTSVGDLEDLAVLTQASFKIPGLDFGLGQQIEELFTALTSPLASLLSLAEDIEAGVGDTLDGLRQVANQAAALMRRARDLTAFLGSQDDPEDAATAAAWARARADALVNLHAVAVNAQKLGATAEEKAQGKGSGKVYVTRDGDTLEDLATRFGTSVERLRELNPSLTGGPLTAGTKLKLP